MLCALVTASPKRLPTTSCRNVTGTATISATIAALRKTSTLMAAQEMPAAHAQHHARPEDQAGEDHVHVGA